MILSNIINGEYSNFAFEKVETKGGVLLEVKIIAEE
jgi:hypothetical protein